MCTRQTAAPFSACHPRSWRTWRWTLGNYAFILPFLLLFCVFILGLIFCSVYMSLHRWDVLASEHPFIGLANFRELFDDARWWISLRNTTYFSFMTVALITVFALVVALAVNQPVRGRDYFRVVFYAPSMLSGVVVGILMRWMMNSQLGVLNYLVVRLGLGRVPWLSDPQVVLPSLSLATLWWCFGLPMLIFIAALQDIPQHLYDAARIDGANGWQLTRYITLPLVRPTILFVVVTQLISHFQVFAQPYIMSDQGGPGRSSFTVILYLYQTAWRFFRMGYATTIALVLAIIIMIFTLLQFRLLGSPSSSEH